MKRIIQGVLGSLLLVTLTGCVEMTAVKYEGEAKSWPTSPSIGDYGFSVPVFRAWPEKPYDVLGYVQFSNPNVDWNQGDMKQAANMAKKMGGTAILIVPKGGAQSPTVGSLLNDLKAPVDRAIAVVLKWK